MRRPDQIPRTTEFTWGQVRAAVKLGLAPLTLCPGVGFLLVEEGVHFPDIQKGIVWPESCNSVWSMGPQHQHPWVLVRNAGPQAQSQASGLRTRAPKDPQAIPTSTLLFEKQGSGVALGVLGVKGGGSAFPAPSLYPPLPKAALTPARASRVLSESAWQSRQGRDLESLGDEDWVCLALGPAFLVHRKCQAAASPGPHLRPSKGFVSGSCCVRCLESLPRPLWESLGQQRSPRSEPTV